MAGTVHELNPVQHITAGYIGQPGKRVFYLQARRRHETITLLIEKQQVEMLAHGIAEFLGELSNKFPDLPEPAEHYSPAEMKLQVPLDPLFRIGQLGLGYDADRDLLVLVAQEGLAEGRSEDDLSSARLFATRSQMRALGLYAITQVKQGRPTCGNCGQPVDPEGHFCPRRNGHKH
jgi:uncharacterized repeat protein (TIGR03847 family)